MAWATLADLPGARMGLAVAGFADGGFNYAVAYGGSSTSPPNATSDTFLYRVTPNDWPVAEISAMPAARTNAAAVHWNGRNYIFGGYIPGTGVFDQTWEHDPIADTYSTLTPMPAARLNHRAMVVGDLAYIFGGQDSSFAVVDDVWIYDLAADSWASGTAMPVGVTEPGIARIRQRLYLIGGYDGTGDSDDMQIYDTATDTWSAGAPMTYARSGLIAGAGDNSGTVYAVAGLLGGTVTVIAEEYDVATDTWSDSAGTIGYLPSGRYQAGWWVFQGTPLANFFAFGGRDNVSPRDESWRTDLFNPGGWIIGAGPIGAPPGTGWQ